MLLACFQSLLLAIMVNLQGDAMTCRKIFFAISSLVLLMQPAWNLRSLLLN
jgi:hypothetical protein